MTTQERLLDVDAVSELMRQPEFADKRFYLISGVMYEMPPVKRRQSKLAVIMSSILLSVVDERHLGEVHTELGCYPHGDRRTLLAPDVAYFSHASLSQQPEDEFLSVMLDLAIEIASPSDSLKQLREKAQIYLDNGSRLVWIVLLAEKGIDVCRAVDGPRLDIEFVPQTGTLSGDDVLPGFELEMTRLFPVAESS